MIVGRCIPFLENEIMAVTKSLLLIQFLFINTCLFGQVLNFKVVEKNGKYVGTVEPDFFDSLAIYPSNNSNDLLDATGILYNSQKGNFEFGIVKNNVDNSSNLLIKISFGWYPLLNISSIEDSLKFSIDWDYRPSPSKLDLEILTRTSEILKNESFWNNNDDRECNDDEENKKWSLYCALYSASVEVFGDFNHRNPALNIVRTTIQEITPDKEYRHRLMDFNNQNSFKEIEELLERSITKLETMLDEEE